MIDVTGLRHRRSLFPYPNSSARLTRVEASEDLAQLRVLLDELLCKLTPQGSDFRIEVGHFIRE